MKDRTNIIIVPIIQIVFYFLAYEISNYLAHKMGLVYSRGVAWGISSNEFVVFSILEDYAYRGSLVILIGVLGIFIGCLFFSKKSKKT